MHRFVALDQKSSARLAIPREARFLRLLALVAAHSGDSPLWLAGAATALIWGSAAWWGFGGRVLLGTLVAGAATTAAARPRPSPRTRLAHATTAPRAPASRSQRSFHIQRAHGCGGGASSWSVGSSGFFRKFLHSRTRQSGSRVDGRPPAWSTAATGTRWIRSFQRSQSMVTRCGSPSVG